MVAMGVNFLDTAELYPVGWNYGALTEKWMGNWLGEGGPGGRTAIAFGVTVLGIRV
jgi:aryl-alcohol dehydrogenase-like predicted oxidoreductase